MPLTWAHAEYIKLCSSIDENRIFDMPPFTKERYIRNERSCDYDIWRFENQLNSLNSNKSVRIEVMAKARVIWTIDDWKSKNSSATKDTGIGTHVADIKFNGKDRKSTRLNSSHVSISYAVFCLKKKKNIVQV